MAYACYHPGAESRGYDADVPNPGIRRKQRGLLLQGDPMVTHIEDLA